LRNVPKLVALLTVAATALTGAAGLANAATPSAATLITLPAITLPTSGTYKAVAPARVLDTRDGTGAPKAPVGPGAFISLSMLGVGGVPATGVSAVVLNLTVTAPTNVGYLTVWPAGTTRPSVSNINFVAGTNRANLVTVALGTVGANVGKVSIFNVQGSVQVIADVLGYYEEGVAAPVGGLYQQVQPDRLLDTRDPAFGGPLLSGEAVSVPVSYNDPATPAVDVNTHIRALAVNITAVSPTKPGYLIAWDGNPALPLPKTSTLNFTPGSITPNMAIVPVGPCVGCSPDATGLPSVTVLNGSLGTVNLLVDIVGFYDDGQLTDQNGVLIPALRFNPVTPTRIIDTRKTPALGATRFTGKATKAITAPASVAGPDTFALVTNTTAVLPTLPTYLTLWAGADPQPLVRNLNAATGQIVANATITDVGPGNVFNVYNDRGTTNFLVDVVGTMELFPPLAAAAAPNTSVKAPTAARTLMRNAAPKPVR